MTKEPAVPLCELLDLMGAYESAIAELYDLFADRVPGRADFWRQLASEEREHARMVVALRDDAEGGGLGVKDCAAGVAAVRRSTEAIRLRIDDVAQNGVSPVRSLAMAQEIETAMNEAGFFDRFATAEGRAQAVLDELRENTSDHGRRVAELARRRNRYSGLVDLGAISEEQLTETLRAAAGEGAAVEAVLRTTFDVGRDEILASLADFHGCAPQRLAPGFSPPGELREEAQARQERLRAARAIPVGLSGNKVAVAMADPRDVVARDAVRALFDGRRVEYRVALADEVEAALKRLGLPAAEPASVGPLDKDEEDIEAEAIEDDSEIARFLNRLVEDALARGASDIHIEPSTKDDIQIRCRIDGAVQRMMVLPRKQRAALVSRIKIMSDLDITERRRPQSGKIRFGRWGGPDIEVRVETYPTAGGTEDASLRLLAAASARPLGSLYFSQRNLAEFTALISQPLGIILCVGPTGSGKTTTLHSAIGHINSDDLRILTVEDPVEIVQPGLRQVQINPRAGLTFATALRSFLRADPDVIMIGEMRDRETAGIAIEASLTGHLVFSTLHTNSASETVVRLLDMGLDPYSFSDALLGVLAQRLVRTICPKCRLSRPLGRDNFQILRDEYGAGPAFDRLEASAEHRVNDPKPGGCPDCNGLGYRGRMPIHELLVASDDVRALVAHKASAAEIRALAVSQGMRTLKQDGIAKFLAGHTTMEEIRGVCSR